MKLSLSYLTCANDKEASEITRVLLEKKLVFCIKKFPVSSSFLWKGKINSATPVSETTEGVKKWVKIVNTYAAGKPCSNNYI